MFRLAWLPRFIPLAFELILADNQVIDMLSTGRTALTSMFGRMLGVPRPVQITPYQQAILKCYLQEH